MVIIDNETRWNSTYLSLSRAIYLHSKIQVYSEDHLQELGEDFLTRDDWDTLRELAAALKPFWSITQWLQGQATAGHHGAIWEALPALELLLTHLEKLKTEVSHPRIVECVNNAWAKLKKYNDLTDSSHSIYAAATLFNPSQNMAFFEKHWTGDQEPWQGIMKETVRQTWRKEYYTHLDGKDKTPEREQHPMEAFLLGTQNLSGSDEFHNYVLRSPQKVTDLRTYNPITWWNDAAEEYPTLHRYALDTLAIPATSAECERIFSSAKKLVTPERNRLSDDIIEAMECLKAWWDCGAITQ